MKVTIKETVTYEIEIDGKNIGSFKKGEEWNGMTEFKTIAGNQKVVVSGFDNGLFTNVLSAPKKQSPELVLVSPSLCGKD